jgi:hypothetical protein
VFEEIHATLFSHGVDSIGLPTAAEWRRLIEQASRRSTFIGVDPDAFPRDFSVYARYHDALLRTIRQRYGLPAPLTLAQLDLFLYANAHRYDVDWIHDTQPLAA